MTRPEASVNVAVILLKQQRFADAEPLLRKGLDFAEHVEPNKWTTFDTRSILGEALLGLQKYAEAEALLVDGFHGLKEREADMPPPFAKKRLTQALERLSRLYDELNKPHQAARWREELARLQAPMPGPKPADLKTAPNPRSEPKP